MAELIVALDVQTRDEAVAKINEIGDAVGFYKIGLELFTAEGPDVVKAVKDLGKKVFLDLKFHDIPRTVERAVKSGGKLPENEVKEAKKKFTIVGGSGGSATSSSLKIGYVTTSPLVVTTSDEAIIKYTFSGTDSSGDDVPEGKEEE